VINRASGKSLLLELLLLRICCLCLYCIKHQAALVYIVYIFLNAVS